jgi:PucR family transcriptional regulator, purine catabolism regulatory protein
VIFGPGWPGGGGCVNNETGQARRGAGTPRRAGGLTVGEVLRFGLLRSAVVLAGQAGIGRPVERLNVMTVPDILPWAKPHELMLTTGYPLPRSARQLAELVRSFADRDLAAFGIKFGTHLRELPAEMLRAADDVQLPVIRIPEDVAFDDILSVVLSEIVNRQAMAISRAQQIHDSFLDIVLGGGALADIVAKLGELVAAAAIIVVDDAGQVLAESRWPEARRLLNEAELMDDAGRLRVRLLAGTRRPGGLGISDTDYVLAPLQAGPLRHGYILALRRGVPFDDFAVVAIEQAAVISALDITRQLATAAVMHQFEANALHDLVSARPPTADDVHAWSDSFGWNFDRALVVVVGRPEWASAGADGRPSQPDRQRGIAQWVGEVHKIDRFAAAAAFTSELVAVMDAEHGADRAPQALWAGLKTVSHREFSLGVSRVFHSAAGVARAYEEARKALQIGRRVVGPGQTTLFGTLGMFRLLSLIDDTDELRTFATDTLGGVLALKPNERTELLRTLEVLLDTQLNVTRAASIQHFHYNTMRYRIQKLERLVGPFTSDSRLCLQLAVALQILAMPELAGT